MSLGNLAGLVPIFILMLLILTLVVTWTQSKTQKHKYIFSTTVVLLIICSFLIHIFGGVYFIEKTFGIANESLLITWGGAIALILLPYLGINYFIDAKISE